MNAEQQAHPSADGIHPDAGAPVEDRQGGTHAPAGTANFSPWIAYCCWTASPFVMAYPVVHPFAWVRAWQYQWAQMAAHVAAREEAEQSARRERWLGRLTPGLN